MKTTQEILKQLRKARSNVKTRKTMPDQIEIEVLDVGKLMDKGCRPTYRKSFGVNDACVDEVVSFLFDKSMRYSIDAISFRSGWCNIKLVETHEKIEIDTWRGNTYISGSAYVVKADTNITPEIMDGVSDLLNDIYEKKVSYEIDDKDLFDIPQWHVQ